MKAREDPERMQEYRRRYDVAHRESRRNGNARRRELERAIDAMTVIQWENLKAAYYHKDRPLFGSYVGTFWRPAHVRGNAENGINVNDYEVLAPKG